MTRFTRSAAIAFVVICAVVAGWACTDDEGDELTLEDYFAQLQKLDDTTSEQTDALFESVDDPTDVEAIKEAMSGFPDIANEFVAGLEALDPPEEAQAAHDEAVEAAQAFAGAIETAVAEAQDAETVEEFEEITSVAELTEVDDRFTAACLDLVDLATSHDIVIDLDCGEEA